MKILSNFDTKLAEKLREQYKEEYGPKNVVVLKRSRWHLFSYVWLPLIVYLLWTIALILALRQLDLLANNVVLFIVWVIWLLLLLHGLWMLSEKFFDYKMDFIIVTPEFISKYDQRGIFARDVEKLLPTHLKTVSIAKEGFAASLFNLGTIYFLSEGDNLKGKLEMDYVENVEKQAKKVRVALWFDRW